MLFRSLHKLWRTRDPKGYHVEYGYSCMGYEIAGGLGVKMAAPDREVYVMVGDGSYLMLSSEIVTSIQEGLKLTIVLVDNHGYNSIGGLSRSLGTDGFGTLYRYRQNGSLGVDSDKPTARLLPVDLAAKLAQRVSGETLSAREIDVLKLMAKGKSNKEIGSALFISEGTVKSHVKAIFAKMNVVSRTEAVATATRRGMIQL